MFNVNAIKNAFGRAAAQYDAQAHLQKHVRTHAITLAPWRRDAHILDVGCGTGALAEEAGSWRITGLDIAPGMCEEARKKCASVNADADAMPFADNHFDGVFSSLMLQWSNDPLATLREIARVLKPGGRAVISTLTQGTLKELERAFAAIDDAPHVSNFLPAPELLLRAAHARFLVVEAQEKTLTEHYPDAMTLMRSLKSIGAANKHDDRRKGLTLPAHMEKLEAAYARESQGLPATWQLLYMVLEKK